MANKSLKIYNPFKALLHGALPLRLNNLLFFIMQFFQIKIYFHLIKIQIFLDKIGWLIIEFFTKILSQTNKQTLRINPL